MNLKSLRLRIVRGLAWRLKTQKYRLKTYLRAYFKNSKPLAQVECEHYLSIAACVKNEGRYLREWIEYHLWAGVEHFYIYDNGSTDNTKETLAPYIESGLVTYHYYVEERKRYKRKQQHLMYNDAIARYRYCTKWLAIIDADEFIALSGEGKVQFGTAGGGWAC